jgi:hypothetical protein
MEDAQVFVPSTQSETLPAPESNVLGSGTLSQYQRDHPAKPVTSSSQPLHGETFYFDVVTFLVEDVLFKVPRLYFERNSAFFRDLFTNLPSTQEGTNDDNPIKLEATEKVDFQRFLTAAFPELSWHASSPTLMNSRSFDEWISVLKLSTAWKFAELRQKALVTLTRFEIDPVEMVILARSYKVEKWMFSAYTQLVRRDAGLSAKEFRILGYDTAFQLCEKREESFRQSLSQYGGSISILDELEEKIVDMARRELNPDNIA